MSFSSRAQQKRRRNSCRKKNPIKLFPFLNWLRKVQTCENSFTHQHRVLIVKKSFIQLTATVTEYSLVSALIFSFTESLDSTWRLPETIFTSLISVINVSVFFPFFFHNWLISQLMKTYFRSLISLISLPVCVGSSRRHVTKLKAWKIQLIRYFASFSREYSYKT